MSFWKREWFYVIVPGPLLYSVRELSTESEHALISGGAKFVYQMTLLNYIYLKTSEVDKGFAPDELTLL